MVQQTPALVQRQGDIYGRTPGNYYQDGGGYGVPGTRKSITDAENARKVEAARREERFQYQHQTQHRLHQDIRASKDMESMGVYVMRNPVSDQKPAMSRESRTPDFSRRTELSDRRTMSRSVERLDTVSRDVESVNREVNGVEVYSRSDNEKDKEYHRNEEEDDEGGFKGGIASDYEKHRNGGQSDSGRGSTVYSSGKAKTERNIDTSPEPNTVTGKLFSNL